MTTYIPVLWDVDQRSLDGQQSKKVWVRWQYLPLTELSAGLNVWPRVSSPACRGNKLVVNQVYFHSIFCLVPLWVNVGCGNQIYFSLSHLLCHAAKSQHHHIWQWSSCPHSSIQLIPLWYCGFTKSQELLVDLLVTKKYFFQFKFWCHLIDCHRFDCHDPIRVTHLICSSTSYQY